MATDIQDVDRLILLLLDDKDMVSLLALNKYTTTLASPSFWQTRFLSKFSVSLGNIDYKTLYITLSYASAQDKLYYCCEYNYFPLVTNLVGKESFNANHGLCALKIAVKHSYIEIIKLLLNKYQYTNYYSSLIDLIETAMKNKHIGITKLLLEYINWNISAYFLSLERILTTSPEILEMIWPKVDIALHYIMVIMSHAVHNGNIEIARFLLTHGATALYNFHTTIVKGNVQMAKLLLEFGAEITEYDIKTAVYSGNTELILFLKENGADIKLIEAYTRKYKQKLIRDAQKIGNIQLCNAYTRKGNRCKNMAQLGTDLCGLHRSHTKKN